MRAGWLALGLPMLALAAAAPLACGEPFVLAMGSGGSGSGAGGGSGGQPTCKPGEDANLSQVYGDCHTIKCGSDGHLATEDDTSDLYDDGNPCTTDTCQMDGSTKHDVAVNARCGSSNTMFCTMKGECVQCLTKADCTSPLECDAKGKCVPVSCTNGIRDTATETDIDCGGMLCSPCADTKLCSFDKDCTSGICAGALPQKCQVPSCDDRWPNGYETDTDCGGAECVGQGKKCGDGQKCRQPTDCTSGVCKAGQCAAPSCTDSVQNGDEAGADCGGSCPKACPG